MSEIERLQKRLHQVEKVVFLLALACMHDNPDDRDSAINHALAELPE